MGVCSGVYDKYRSSFFSVETIPGVLIRVALAAIAVAGAVLSYFYGQHIGLTIGVGLAPVPLFFADAIQLCCCRRKRTEETNIKPVLFTPVDFFKTFGTADLYKLESEFTPMDVDRLKKALEQGFSPNAKNKDGETVTQFSLRLKDWAKAKVLIEDSRCHLKAITALGTTLVELALIHGEENNKEVQEIVFYLLSRQFDINTISNTSNMVKFLHFLFVYDKDGKFKAMEFQFLEGPIGKNVEELINRSLQLFRKDQLFLNHLFKLLKDKPDFHDLVLMKLEQTLTHTDTHEVYEPLLKHFDPTRVKTEAMVKVLLKVKQNDADRFCAAFMERFQDPMALKAVQTAFTQQKPKEANLNYEAVEKALFLKK